MPVSVFDIFKAGIGPSSSHTVGPMRAARMFVDALSAAHALKRVHAVRVELFGSLGATGKGHGTDRGVLLGLMGYSPEDIEPDAIDPLLETVRRSGQLPLHGNHPIAFCERTCILYFRRAMVEHPNGLALSATDSAGNMVMVARYLSVGGGFVVGLDEPRQTKVGSPVEQAFPFTTGKQLLQHCHHHGMSMAQVMLANECAWRDEAVVRQRLLSLWTVMQQCVRRGSGIDHPQADLNLPGPLKVRRRGPALYRDLMRQPRDEDPMEIMDWVNQFAIAVNEENAAGGRVVTAPTNGAAGIIPSVLHYYQRFITDASDDGIVEFLLTAAAIAVLYKENASISGAEVGCQGEVGVACSMAAGALAHVMGGTPSQVENAAEIGMEHNLGLTCDPVGGLVQIPCIERNAMGAVKAINAARIALRGDGNHQVSLDAVIETMRQTGADMKTKYKETSRGGLAVNIVEC